MFKAFVGCFNQANEVVLSDSVEGEEGMDKIEKIMSLIESVEDEIAEAVILADRGYTDEAKEAYAKAFSIKEQIKCVLCELYGEGMSWQEVVG